MFSIGVFRANKDTAIADGKKKQLRLACNGSYARVRRIILSTGNEGAALEQFDWVIGSLHNWRIQ